jgi:hypothetical protein
MRFFDVKVKKPFESSKYRLEAKVVNGKKRNFAVATSPFSGIEAWRVL